MVEVTDKHRESYRDRDDTHAAGEVHSCTNGDGIHVIVNFVHCVTLPGKITV